MRSILFALTTFLFSCNLYDRHHKKAFIKDQDFIEAARQYSPDSTKVLLTYGIDQGALGQGIVGTAILKLSDTAKDLKPFTISANIYQSCKWLGNDTAAFYYDYLKRMRQKLTRIYYNLPDTISGVHLLFTIVDPIDSTFTIDTLFQQQSPDNKWKVAVYRYLKGKLRDNFLNISVLKSDELLPKYGNFFISDTKNDCIYSCQWTSDNKLIFYTNGSCKNIIENYLVQGRPDISYQIVADDKKYGTTLRWINKSGM